jgi:hypothetical protein
MIDRLNTQYTSTCQYAKWVLCACLHCSSTECWLMKSFASYGSCEITGRTKFASIRSQWNCHMSGNHCLWGEACMLSLPFPCIARWSHHSAYILAHTERAWAGTCHDCFLSVLLEFFPGAYILELTGMWERLLSAWVFVWEMWGFKNEISITLST